MTAMFGKKSVYRRQFDALEAELKMNLENNYKDLARAALKKIADFVENMESAPEGAPKPEQKEMLRFRETVDAYEQQMKNYHH